MRIPNDKLHISTARQYGAIDGLEFDDIEQMQGCPARYKKYVHEGKHEVRPAGPDPLTYGSMIHRALYMAEAKEIPLLPDALVRCWDTSLPPEMYKEAENDLRRFLEKGGVAGGITTVYVEKALEMPLMEWNGKPYGFGGIVDLIGLDANDESTVYFVDYKTNRSPTSQDELDADVQFTGYGKLIWENLGTLFPGLHPTRVVGVMEALKFETLFREITARDREVFTAWATAVANRILEDKKGKPRLNRWCGHCPDRWECPAWLAIPGEGQTLMDKMAGASTLLDRVKVKHEIEEILNQLNNAVDSVKEELLESPGEYDGFVYSVDDKWVTKTDLLKMHDILGARFYEYVNERKTALDGYAKEHPELKADIEATRTRVVAGVKLGKKKMK